MIEHVTDGGMILLKELPKQENKALSEKYFDQFVTYSPFTWKGSRRLTKEEISELENKVHINEDSV